PAGDTAPATRVSVAATHHAADRRNLQPRSAGGWRGHERGGRGQSEAGRAHGGGRPTLPAPCERGRQGTARLAFDGEDHVAPVIPARALDRKSTRLNSSHV